MILSCVVCLAGYPQTYTYMYTVNSLDTMSGEDTTLKKEVWAQPITNYYEQNYVKSGNYRAVYYENGKNNFLGAQNCKLNIIVYDYAKQLVWTSADSSYKKMIYVSPVKITNVSSRLIRYDLAPGIYAIADKQLPMWVCPDVYISGLKYGILKVVTNNDVIELKTYKSLPKAPPSIEDVQDIFKEVSADSVKGIYPSFPPNRKKRVGIKQQ